MKVLLDTHTWLWMLTAPDRLPDRVRRLVTQTGNEVLLSAASAWEIAIKHQLGRLPLPEEPETCVPSRLAASGCTELPIDHSHVLRAGALPPHHRDPFDRLLVAQAQILDIPLLSRDQLLDHYQVNLVWK